MANQNATSTRNASTPNLSAADQIKAAQAQIKALRDKQKAMREAAKAEKVGKSKETAKKYITIFEDRAKRLRAKAVKCDELVAMLRKRLETK